MNNERATVVILHGSSADRLRQALGQGLVRKEVLADIENALAEAAQVQSWCDTLSQQNFELQNQVYYLDDMNKKLQTENGKLRNEIQQRARNYEKAIKAAQEEQQRKKNRRDALTFFLTAGTVFLAAVAAVFCGITLFYTTWIR